MSKAELYSKIGVQKSNIEVTKQAMVGTRGVVQDVLRSILPIMEEQLEIMEGIVDLLPNE